MFISSPCSPVRQPIPVVLHSQNSLSTVMLVAEHATPRPNRRNRID